MNDLSPMPFGKHAGKTMQDVPASYLHWLYHEGNIKSDLRSYIEDSWTGLQQETPDLIWIKKK